MSGVLLEFVRSSVGPYLFDGLLEELGNLNTSEVNYRALFSYIPLRACHPADSAIWPVVPVALHCARGKFWVDQSLL